MVSRVVSIDGSSPLVFTGGAYASGAAPSGATAFSYDAASDSYTVQGITGPGGTVSVSFGAADKIAGTGYGVAYSKTAGGVTNTLVLYGNVRADTAGTPPIQLSYTSFGLWTTTNGSIAASNSFVFGQQTPAASVPTSGTATYQAFVAARQTEMGAVPFNETNISGSATFSADFGAGKVSTALSLIGKTFDGTAPINGNAFSGQLNLAGTSTGSFAGNFFGPSAQEMGYGFYIQQHNPDPYAGATPAAANTYLTGVVVGRKQ